MPLYNKPSLQLLVDLVNLANPSLPVPLTDTNVKWGTPASQTPVGVNNSNVLVTSRATGVYIGKQTLQFRRLDMATLFRSVPIRIDKYSPAAAGASPYKLSDLLGDINTKYGLNLQLSDIVDVSLPAGTTNAVPSIGLPAGTRNSSATLTMASASYGFVGSVTVYWVQAPQDIANMISVNSLSQALTYPGLRDVVDNTMVVPDLLSYSYDWTDDLNAATTASGQSTLANFISQMQNTGFQATASSNAFLNMLNAVSTPLGTTFTQTNPGTSPLSLYGLKTSGIIDLSLTANQTLYPDANYVDFNRAIYLDVPSSTTWGVGRMWFHYNG